MAKAGAGRKSRNAPQTHQAQSGTGDGGLGRSEALNVATGAEHTALSILEVDPDDILIDPELKQMREWSGSSRQELQLQELARLIGEEGQKQPCLVRETSEGYMLVAGHRRLEAVKLLREEDPEFMLKVWVDEAIQTEEQALRAALIENIQREDFTAIEFAKQIKALRKRFDAEDNGKGTIAISDFLGVSPATVTQTEKLLRLPTEVQEAVQAGRMTPSAALELTATKPEKQPEVASLAEQKAEEEEVERQVKREMAKDKKKQVGKSPQSSKQIAEYRRDIKATREAAVAAAKAAGLEPDKPKVQGKHVRAAAKSVEGATDKSKAPKLGELLETFEQWSGPAYPKVMSDFAAAVVEYGHGRMTDKKFEAAWDDVADVCHKAERQSGTKAAKATKAVKEPKKHAAKPKPTVKPKAKGKAVVKGKGKAAGGKKK